MRRVAIAVAGFVMLGAAPALAQYGPYGPPRPMMPLSGMAGEDVTGIVRSMGLNPVGPPARSGHFYIQRVADYYGRPLRVIVDATRGQVVSVEPLGAPGSITGGPYAANGPYAGPGGPYGRRPYPPYGMSPDEDEFDGPPARRAALGQPQMEPYHPGTPMQPPRAAVKPAAKSAAITPGRTPVPRKRPVAAPQETAGTIEPLAKPAEAPQVKPAEPMPEPAATPAIPPVAPLE